MVPFDVHNMKGFLDRVIINYSENSLSLSYHNTRSVFLKLFKTVLNCHSGIIVRLLINRKVLYELLKVLTWSRFVLSFPEHLLDSKRETWIASLKSVLKNKDYFLVFELSIDNDWNGLDY